MTTPRTFDNEPTLPRLPVPDLTETCKRYLHSLRPLATAQELERSCAYVEHFLKHEGPVLQRRLLQHEEEQARTSPQGSWIEKWWLERAYLIWRDPIAINVNWFIITDEHPVSRDGGFVDPLVRSAAFACNLARSYLMIREETLPAQYARKTPLSMNQYRYIFSTVRKPGEQCDSLHTYRDQRHFVVIVRDYYYEIQLLDEEHQPLPEHVVYAQIRSAVEQTPSSPPPLSLSVLTAGRRDVWYRARSALERDTINQRSLDVLDRSLFCIALDLDAAPQALDDAAAIYLHNNTARNRFFDKSLVVVVTANGRLGISGEHTPQDAPAPSLMLNIALNLESSEQYNAIASSALLSPTSVPARALPIDTSALDVAAYEECNASVLTAIRNVSVCMLDFRAFGSVGIRSLKCSPDCFMQMAMQLAFHNMFGEVCATYETAGTRQFRHGRTETVRTCSEDTRSFVETPKHDEVLRRERLDKAMASHIEYMSASSRGRGVDRHFLGLRCCLKEGEPVPEIFTDPLFAASTTYRLSTSNMTIGDKRKQLFSGGFGPACKDGFGISYIFHPDRCIISITAGPLVDVCAFREAFHSALIELFSLVQRTNAHKQGKDAARKQAKL
eukprot:TRINITY_DN4534_c0_g2_i1.p1 TRINITY_DN4534_c0_g2~~TRINITY_DN4534_c0_g2_i1.p1  ORF type:complete len:625 (-),score=170.79 TRINITY_DN4534_c0_g2_i1:162-2003(-)